MNKILIVGSGPAAYGFLKGIKDFKSTQVTLIDNSNISSSQANCMFNLDQSYYGNRLGDTKNVIEHNDFSQLKNIPYISKSFGGFSNVWGGTIHDIPEKLKNKLKNQNISLEEEFKEINGQIKKISKGKNEDKNVIETLGFLGLDYFKNKNLLNNTNYKFSLTAINDEIIDLVQKNSICERCGNYSWSCNSNSIWNTKKYIKNLIKDGSIKYLPNTKLKSFYEEDSIVICNLLDNRDDYKLYFNKLIIGAGPIGSSIIYLNSRVVNKVVINSSDLIKYPLIKFFKTNGKKDLFSDLFIDFEIEGNTYFSQLYFFSKGVLILSPYSHILKKIINSLPEILINFFGGIFVYLDQDISSKLIIERKNNKINFDFIDLNKLGRNSYLITKFFTKNKLFLLPFIKTVHKFGTSNHLGGQFPHKDLDSDHNSSDRYGRVGSLINTHLIDGSVLPHIASGPLTITIMANSLRIARELKL